MPVRYYRNSFSEKLDPDRQITMVEDIATMLFDPEGLTDEQLERYERPDEDICHSIANEILLMVLSEFRPAYVTSS